MNNVTVNVQLSDGTTVEVSGYTIFGQDGDVCEQEAFVEGIDWCNLSINDQDIVSDALTDACWETYGSQDYTPEWDDEYLIDGVGFADPGGRSALRAATTRNPRDRPCPTCGRENVLTRIDVQHGYQCDHCADMAEGRMW